VQALLDAIGDRSRGFLIDAREYLKTEFGEEPYNPAFRLITNACQREFLSLWKLFDWPSLLEYTAKTLTEEILAIRSAKPFNIAVTNSPVAWRLLEYLHPWVEEPRLMGEPTFVSASLRPLEEEGRGGEKLVMTYLGAHGAALRGESTSAIGGARALLFTDVIGRRGSTLECARLVERFGGDCVAIVAPVLISPDLILFEILTAERPVLRIPYRNSTAIRVHSLCHFPIREMASSSDRRGALPAYPLRCAAIRSARPGLLFTWKTMERSRQLRRSLRMRALAQRSYTIEPTTS
jgi:hypothetical protein